MSLDFSNMSAQELLAFIKRSIDSCKARLDQAELEYDEAQEMYFIALKDTESKLLSEDALSGYSYRKHLATANLEASLQDWNISVKRYYEVLLGAYS